MIAMLEKIGSIEKFKYSFIAFIGLAIAVIFNLLFIFNGIVVTALCILCLVFILFSVNFFETYKKLFITFATFVFIGLVNSYFYNTHSRVFELSDMIHNEKAWVTGEIIEIKEKDKYARVFIKNPKVYSDVLNNLEYNHVPQLIISTHASRVKDAHIGDTITAKVLLRKPNSKLFQDDFDYNDYLLQNKINLTAQVRGDIYIDHYEGEHDNLLASIMNYRLDIADKIKNTYENQEIAGLSTALITGLRGQLDNDIRVHFKDSGLAHLMAISGMHMGFLAAIIFFLVRYIICLIPAIALNYNSKNIAGAVTIAFAFFYLLLAGNTLPTLRAFLMILIFTVTMMMGRSKVALHTLCLIAIAILLVDPMSIFSASFQLSFTAVFAILLYNQAQANKLILSQTKVTRLVRFFSNTLNISIIAFTATIFIVASHFGYISIYSIAANVIASMLMAFVVMPCLFLFYVGYIVLDLSAFAHLNEFSLNLLNNLATYFAGFENSSIYICDNYAWVLLAVTVIILSLIVLDINRKYLIATGVYLTALIVPLTIDLRPEIIEFGNNNLGIRQDNKLIILGELEKRQVKRVLNFYRLELKEDNDLPKSCDLTGCLYTYKDKKILQVNEGFDINFEELNLADYVIYKN
jgi:competence protein ComEC